VLCARLTILLPARLCVRLLAFASSARLLTSHGLTTSIAPALCTTPPPPPSSESESCSPLHTRLVLDARWLSQLCPLDSPTSEAMVAPARNTHSESLVFVVVSRKAEVWWRRWRAGSRVCDSCVVERARGRRSAGMLDLLLEEGKGLMGW